MKAAETKSTHSQQHQTAESASLAIEQERAFFSEHPVEASPFFNTGSSPTIQTKLSNEQAPFFQPAHVPLIQPKCSACETQEKQAEIPDLQGMSAFESDEDGIQRQPLPRTEAIPSTTATLQMKCADCEAEEGDQSEEESKESPQIQQSPAFESIDQTKDTDEPSTQFKLTIGQPGDAYEREADTMAERVVSMPDPQSLPSSELQAKPLTESIASPLQSENSKIQTSRIAHEIAENRGSHVNLQSQAAVHKQASGSSTTLGDITSRLQNSQGSGDRLDDSTRFHMESAFGKDFSGVRIHTKSDAAQLSQDLGAKAFTHGSDIYFNTGQYNPTSREGEHLLAHELTHTVQQGKAPSLDTSTTESAPTSTSDQKPKIQPKLEDYEQPGHGDNPRRRLEAEIAEEVDPEDIEAGKRNGSNYERPDPAEKRQAAEAMKAPASPDINEAEIARPRNEQLAIEGEEKVENPEQLVEEGEAQQEIEPQGQPTSEESTIQQAQSRAQRLLARSQAIEQPAKPEEVTVPEPFLPIDAAGEPLPFDAEGQTQVNEAARNTQLLRDKGQTLIVQARESMSQADVMEGRLEVTKAAVAESDRNVNTLEEAYTARRESVQQAEEGLRVSEEKQQREAQEIPQYIEEANEQKQESATVAEESREKKAENERNRPDEPEDRAKAEEQAGEIERAANAGESIDNAFGQAQQQAQLLLEKNTEAQQKNTETRAKTDQMHTLLDQGDAKVVELRNANISASAQMEARSQEPEQVRQQSRRMEQAGLKMVVDSEAREQELGAAQQKYRDDLAAIPEFNLEQQLQAEAEAGRTPGLFVQRQADGQAQGDYSNLINVLQGTFLDPASNRTLQEREAAARAAQERRGREVQRINQFYDKPFEEYTAWEKIKAGLGAKWQNFTGWLSNLTFGNIIGGLGHLILDAFNPLAYLRGIGVGLMQVINGSVNAVAALLRGDFWTFLKGTADIATGVAIIAGTITALSLTIAAAMTALMIFTLGGLAGVAIPVITAMSNIMAWSGPIAYWSGLAALGLNAILGIKSLVDMATADSADQLAAETDDLMQDVQNGVTGGAMALVGAAGRSLGPQLLTNAQALTLAGAIGGRGWLVRALAVESLASLWGVVSLRGVRRWFAGKFDDLRNWWQRRRGRAGGDDLDGLPAEHEPPNTGEPRGPAPDTPSPGGRYRQNPDGTRVGIERGVLCRFASPCTPIEQLYQRQLDRNPTWRQQLDDLNARNLAGQDILDDLANYERVLRRGKELDVLSRSVAQAREELTRLGTTDIPPNRWTKLERQVNELENRLSRLNDRLNSRTGMSSGEATALSGEIRSLSNQLSLLGGRLGVPSLQRTADLLWRQTFRDAAREMPNLSQSLVERVFQRLEQLSPNEADIFRRQLDRALSSMQHNPNGQFEVMIERALSQPNSGSHLRTQLDAMPHGIPEYNAQQVANTFRSNIGIDERHIFEGEVNRAVTPHRATGVHHISAVQSGNARIIPGTRTPGPNGTFSASVEILDPVSGHWVRKATPSTFWPSNMSRSQVISEIAGAYNNPAGIINNITDAATGLAVQSIESITPSGIRVRIITFPGSGRVRSAFPLP